MRQIRWFRDALTAQFGKPLQRIPIDLYLSCPHRSQGGHGCLFCPEDGAAARHLRRTLNIPGQVQKGIAYVKKRYDADAPYIAYFQSYTNTYGDVGLLRRLYEETLSQADFAVVMIATRPDCLDNEVLDYLCELQQRYEVWVELGVQSSHDATLRRINRGHDSACAESAIRRLSARGIHVAVHVIIGLPGETESHFRDTAKWLSALPVKGIKFHQMMILSKTPLVKLYQEEPELFNVRNEYDYAVGLRIMLNELPDSWIVMRLCADAPEEHLIAPKWWMRKGQFLNFFETFYSAPKGVDDGILVQTEDGSMTAFHPQYRQHFHHAGGAESEAIIRFIRPCGLAEHLIHEEVSILDIGFGLGYNALTAADVAETTRLHRLQIDTVESDPRVFPLALRAQESAERKRHIERLCAMGHSNTQYVGIYLFQEDARHFIQRTPRTYDVVFLDAFSPDVNPELWSYDLFRLLFKKLNPNGILLTYSTAFPVIGALLRAGFRLGSTPSFGGKRGGLLAVKGELPDGIPPLRDKDIRIASHTLAGVVYRDPLFSQTHQQLRKRRHRTVERLRRRGIPKWL